MVMTKNATRSVVIRPMEDDDVEGVFSLYDEVFGPESGECIRMRWNWSYVNCPMPEQSPKWVLSDGGRVVGFLAAMALPYVVNGRRVIANTTRDYMVHPDYRFYGMKLMQAFFDATDNCVTCDDMEATLKVTQWFGAKPVGDMVRYVKVLDARFLKLRGRMASVPSPLMWPVTQSFRLKDSIKSRHLSSGAKIEAVNHFDERFDRFAQAQSESAPAMIQRNAEFMNWRYGSESPYGRVCIGAMNGEDGELEGYVIYYVSETKGNEHLGHIVDLQVQKGSDSRITAALMQHALKNLRKQGAWAVYYRSIPSSKNAIAYEALKDYGFLPRGRHVFMVKMKDDEMAAVAESGANWNYSFGDSEASHFLL